MSGPDTQERPRNLLQRTWPVIAVIACVVGIPLVLAIITGGLGIPHNDAWSHSRIAETFARTGEIQLLAWNRTALIGQIVILGPLGSSIVAQQVVVALFSAIGLVSTYALLEPRIGRARALITLASLGATAEFVLLSTSFMSDIPAWAGIMTALALADRAVRVERAWPWLLGLLVAAWATTVRDQAVAIVIAVIVIGWWSLRRARTLVAISSVVILTAIAAFELWRRALPFGDPPMTYFAPGLIVKMSLLALITTGFVLAPLIAFVARPRTWPARSWIAAGITLAVAIGWAAIRWQEALFGNYLTPAGAYPTVILGWGNPITLPGWVWTIVVVIAVLGAATGVGQLVAVGIRTDRVIAVALIILLVFALAPSVLGQELFGRSLLAIWPLIAVLLARRPSSDARPLEAPRWNRAIAAIVLAINATIALAVAAHALSFDSARWRLAEALVADGWRPTLIDAGLEWNGTHAPGPYSFAGRVEPCESADATHPRVVVVPAATAAALGADSIASLDYPTFAIAGSSTLIAIPDPECAG